MKILVAVKGGPGSGNWGHTGRPGLVGGSGGGGLSIAVSGIQDYVKHSKYKGVLYRGGSAGARQRMESGEFDPKRAGAHVWQGSGIYMTPDESTAARYGEAVKMVVDLRKPFVGTVGQIENIIDGFDLQPPQVELPGGAKLGIRAWPTPGHKMAALRTAWLDAGYDGIIQQADFGGTQVVVAFEPTSVRVVQELR